MGTNIIVRVLSKDFHTSIWYGFFARWVKQKTKSHNIETIYSDLATISEYETNVNYLVFIFENQINKENIITCK